jgi:lipopolysaccharide biosynthesis protein
MPVEKIRRLARWSGYTATLLKLGLRDPKGTFFSTKNARKLVGAYSRGGASEVARLIRATRSMPVMETGPRTVSLAEEYALAVSTRARKKDGIDLEFVSKAAERIAVERAPVKAIAFYLPQFHPIPENDAWWGEGFTEWTNVTKAAPQYLGHHQPQLPIDVGFYDLRLVETMEKQARLADWYGIGGFCFHYYWFGGKRLLERPIDQYLASKTIKLPFCFCWANENWTRRWDGQENEVLISQKYSPEDDIAFIEALFPAFSDPRYIRHDGKPMLIVYRVSQLPDPKATANRWRQRCREAGIGEIYLIAARSFEITDPRPYGFDAAIEFPPHQIPASNITKQISLVTPYFRGNINSYEDLADGYASQRTADYPLIKTVSPGWDNEARRPGAGHIFHGSSPSAYASWFKRSVAYAVEQTAADTNYPSFVFINAWNEWAEGAHLEPDRRYGYAYLHATGNILRDLYVASEEVSERVKASSDRFEKKNDTLVIVHVHYEELIGEIVDTLSRLRGVDVTISAGRAVSEKSIRYLLDNLPGVRIELFDNRGRDLAPFLDQLAFAREQGYRYACKVHTKKSPQRNDGEALRRHAFDELIGSQAIFAKNRKRFEDDPTLGMLAPSGSVLSLAHPPRHVLNRRWLDYLFQQLDIGELTESYDCDFVAGSMFWFRMDALKRVAELKLLPEMFEYEVGQVDGTLAHAVERVLAAAAAKSSFRTEEL